MEGVFCANYCNSRGNFPPCYQAWHGKCFTLESAEFPIRRIHDQMGNPWHKDEERVAEIESAAGAEGVHAVLPFQCPTCWMRNLENRDPGPGDGAYLRSIRRATLDAINGLSRPTIAHHRGRAARMVANAERIGKTPSLLPRGPMPLGDTVGMSLAVDILQYSIHAKGRTEEVVQPDTLRQLRSTYTKNYESSLAGVSEALGFSSGPGRVKVTACPTQSEWYARFWLGLEKRMGYKGSANQGLSVEAMVYTIKLLEQDARSSNSRRERRHLTKVAAYLTLCTTGGLRGNEGFYLDLAALRDNLDIGRHGRLPRGYSPTNRILTELECRKLPHIVIPLLGKFKGSNTVDHHHINLASQSVSGLELRKWMEALVDTCEEEGRTQGPAFADGRGNLAYPPAYDYTFKTYLKRTQRADSDLIPATDEVNAMYGISRTPRRTLASRARRAGFKTGEIKEMCRWGTVEAAKGKRPHLEMCMLYADAVHMMPVTWRISHAL